MIARGTGRKIPNWTLVRGWAGEISPGDVAWSDPSRTPTEEPDDEVTLIPYGCTNIRITEFPKVKAK